MSKLPDDFKVSMPWKGSSVLSIPYLFKYLGKYPLHHVHTKPRSHNAFTTSYKNQGRSKDVIGSCRNVVRTYRGFDGRGGPGQILNMLKRNVARTGRN